MEFKDYYATFGVSKTASGKEIKQVYRKLARKLHPDVNPGNRAAEARFKEINEAYEVLGDPEKRRKYDELGANWRRYEPAQQAGGSPFTGGFSFEDGPFGGGAWTVNVDGPGGSRPMSEDEVREIFGNEDPFSDFFKTFFGGSRSERRRTTRAPRPRQGRDVEREIELSLEDAFDGVTRRLSLTHGGRSRRVDVRIPAGVREGSRIRIAGEGETGSGGAASGNLYLRVRVRPHPVFERRGQDLHVKVSLPVTTAALGGEARVPTLGGSPLRLKIPEGTQQGQVFRLKGQGMPAVGKPAERGDLYATVEIQVPRSLTPEQRRLYEALAKLESGTRNSAA